MQRNTGSQWQSAADGFPVLSHGHKQSTATALMGRTLPNWAHSTHSLATLRIAQTDGQDTKSGGGFLAHSQSVKAVPRPPPTHAENAKQETIQRYLKGKRDAQEKTMHAVTMQRVGPGSYFKDQRLDTLGKHKPSNSVKGFGNGFISRVDRGLLDPVAGGLVQADPHSRSQSQPRQGMGQ